MMMMKGGGEFGGGDAVGWTGGMIGTGDDGTVGGGESWMSVSSTLDSMSSSPSRVSRKEEGEYTKEGFSFHC